MTNSRRKGATGERAFAAAVLNTLGVRLVRQLDQCRAGGFDLAPEPTDDSACAVLLRGFTIECKRHRTATPGEVAAWWTQTCRQADDAGLAPLLAYRPDRAPWRVVLALDALAHLRHTQPDAHLTLIGDGEMRPQIEARIDALGLDGNITLTGWVDEARILHELQNAHALLMPNFAEGLPMVIMEAMAAGRLVIATYIAGTPELVQDGVTGWMVPAGDAQALARAMAALAQTDPDTRNEMAAAARARVLERHDVATEAAKLAGLIAQSSDTPI